MPELTPDERLEVEVDRRRRVNAALRLGSEAATTGGGPSITPLAAGVAIAIMIALILGVIALAQSASSSSGASHSPAVVSPSP